MRFDHPRLANIDAESSIGGGALPELTLPTRALAIAGPGPDVPAWMGIHRTNKPHGGTFGMSNVPQHLVVISRIVLELGHSQSPLPGDHRAARESIPAPVNDLPSATAAADCATRIRCSYTACCRL